MRPVLLRTIAATTDLDDASLTALEVAHRLTVAAGADLHVVHVAHGEPSQGLSDHLNKILRRARMSPDDVKTHIVQGPPAAAIRSTAERLKADVIVVGAHRGGDLGSTALAVVMESRVPCLVVSNEALRLPLNKVLVPVDGSETARGALLVGLSWASALRNPDADPESPRTSLVGLHVVDRATDKAPLDRDALERELNVARENAGDWAGVAITSDVIDSASVGGAILTYAEEKRADLVVLGTRGRGLDTSDRLGSVSTEVAKSLKTPVLLVSNAVWKAYADGD